MHTIEVLVATMDQNDFSKYREMNISTDAVFANQSVSYKYQEKVINNSQVKMITTSTKGVGKNRNIALQNATADICLLSDDDVHYNNNYQEIIRRAFIEIPKADIIVFNIETKGMKVNRRKNKKVKKVSIVNFQNYGAVRIAFRKNSIIKANIWFSLLFGGGSTYSSGEDTLFLREALRKGLNIYTYPYSIGIVDQTSSSWFTGYNEKFFFDKGALVASVFPRFKYLIGLLYYPMRFRKVTKIPIRKMQYYILSGIKAFSNNLSYDQWQNKTK